MRITKILIVLSLALLLPTDQKPLNEAAGIYEYAGESILYFISPIGRTEYKDLGIVDLKGVKVNLVTFKTQVPFFKDTEKIYSDPQTSLPYRIERDISGMFGKEYIIEEYNQKKFTLTLKKFKGKKLVSEQVIKAGGPIHNAILLPFSLRKRQDLAIGWHMTARLPNEFKVEIVSIDEITVPAGKFQAYHFKSKPDKFEIWLNKNNPRLPLKIQGKGIFDYALLMKEYGLK